jgi:hypothetical protein
VRAAVVIGALVALQGTAAAGEREGDRRATNTFVLLTAATAKPQSSQPLVSSNGVGVPPAKPVVSNPYQVPLLQNAGTLRGAR